MSSTRQVAVVTGGAGFIGSHMVDVLLDGGYRVRVIDNLSGGRTANLAHHARNPDLSFEESDIRALAPEASLFRGADYVFHFAGIGDVVPSIERPLEYMDTNVQGTAHVLEAARHARVRKFVYAASSSCYGIAATPTRPTRTRLPNQSRSTGPRVTPRNISGDSRTWARKRCGSSKSNGVVRTQVTTLRTPAPARRATARAGE